MASKSWALRESPWTQTRVGPPGRTQPFAVNKAMKSRWAETGEMAFEHAAWP